jgi:hypothetical protein
MPLSLVFPVPPPGVADNQYVMAIHANDRTQSEPHKADNRRQGRISYKFVPKRYVSTTPNTRNLIGPKKSCTQITLNCMLLS